jgi:hypothetical protein
VAEAEADIEGEVELRERHRAIDPRWGRIGRDACDGEGGKRQERSESSCHRSEE